MPNIVVFIVAISIDGQFFLYIRIQDRYHEPNRSSKTISMEIKMGASHVDRKAKLL